MDPTILHLLLNLSSNKKRGVYCSYQEFQATCQGIANNHPIHLACHQVLAPLDTSFFYSSSDPPFGGKYGLLLGDLKSNDSLSQGGHSLPCGNSCTLGCLCIHIFINNLVIEMQVDRHRGVLNGCALQNNRMCCSS